MSESDLSEISPIGGASGSGTQSPVQMMAPSDDDNDSTGKLWKNCTAAANRLLYVARIWVVYTIELAKLYAAYYYDRLFVDRIWWAAQERERL